ncbi:MAG: hypothetical protein R3252_11425 [Robiginitalea sp.]|nr:hypothetical protein [Robiginitalea sp.]
MKHFVLFFAALLIGVGNSRAEASENKVATATMFGYSNSFIFMENGVTFSVYPDGEFDFYIDNQLQVQAGVRLGAAAITFNSGYNYNPFVQYDDYGAVIQVQRVPVFYDFYGRVNRIGGVWISYRNNRVYRLGGMRVFYTPLGYYDYHIGYINPYNRIYAYRPFHRFFVRPALGYCMVYNHPYRRYYHPVRYTYHRPYRNNVRRAYAHVGKTYRYRPRTERARIYRNDHRVVARESVRNNRSNSTRTARSTQRQGNAARYSENTSGRSTRTVGKGRAVTQRERSNLRTSRAAQTGRTKVANRSSRVRAESGRNVRQSSRAGVDRADRGIVRNSRSKTRVSKVRSSERTEGRSRAVTQRTKRTPDRAARRSGRD